MTQTLNKLELEFWKQNFIEFHSLKICSSYVKVRKSKEKPDYQILVVAWVLGVLEGICGSLSYSHRKVLFRHCQNLKNVLDVIQRTCRYQTLVEMVQEKLSTYPVGQ